MDWKRLLAYVTGSVDEEILLRNEYLATKNRILRGQIKSRLRLTDGDRRSLAEIGKRLGREALEEVATIVCPDTILAWPRRLVAKKFDGSRNRRSPGRPPVAREVEKLVIQFAAENLGNLGHTVSDQTVANILARRGLAPRPRGRSGPRGASSSVPTSTSSLRPTSSPPRCGPRPACSPTTCSSSSTSPPKRSTSPASPRTRMPPG